MNIIKNKGFTLIELLLVIAVVTLLSLIIMPNLANFQNERSLENTSANIISYLNEAKSNSTSSINSTNYGIHFESNSIIYFTGDVFSAGDINNREVNFEPGVIIDPNGGINLNGGGNDVIFPRLTGNVIGYGTITIELTSKPTLKKIITINKVGSISLN